LFDDEVIGFEEGGPGVGWFGEEGLPGDAGEVGGAGVGDEDLVGDGVEVEFEVEVLDGGGDAAFLVSGGDDDGEHGRGRGGWKKKLKAEMLKS
jgi:hypothetical protein